MHLYLVRHAESVNNALPTYKRTEDPAITNVGRLQAQCLAGWVKRLSIDVLITSPFLRTLQTTDAILQERRMPVHVWDEVYERGGCYRGYNEENVEPARGLGRTAIRRQLEASTAEIQIDDSISEAGWFSDRPRETDPEALLRAARVRDRLLREFSGGESVMLVTHADFKRMVIAKMLGDQVNAARLGRFRNTGVTRINLQDGSWQLDYFNSVTHMPDRLVTGNEH